jgi:hypothetical protein
MTEFATASQLSASEDGRLADSTGWAKQGRRRDGPGERARVLADLVSASIYCASLGQPWRPPRRLPLNPRDLPGVRWPAA